MNKITFTIVMLFALMVLFFVWFTPSELQKEEHPQPPVVMEEPETREEVPTGEVIRRTRVQRGGDFMENIFYVGEKVIATQKVYADGRMEETGRIPDGSVKFYDEYEQTHGDEYYVQGKRNGTVNVYYENGKLKAQKNYVFGQLMADTEYYENGIPRFEIDYSDALLGIDPKESGVGKLYYPSGVLKYEWSLTRAQNGGYKRSYNQDGTLRADSRYNEFGHLTANIPVAVQEPLPEGVSQ